MSRIKGNEEQYRSESADGDSIPDVQTQRALFSVGFKHHLFVFYRDHLGVAVYFLTGGDDVRGVFSVSPREWSVFLSVQQCMLCASTQTMINHPRSML